MKSRHIKRNQLALYQLDELMESEKIWIEQHLKTCSRCQQALSAENDLHRLFRLPSQMEPDEILLETCRTQLKDNIRKLKSNGQKRFIWTSLGEFFSYQIPVSRLAAITLLFVCGIILGRLLPKQSAGRITSPEEAVRILQTYMSTGDFQIIPSDNNPNRVEIRFKSVQENRVVGRLQDPSIRYLLSYALMNDPRDNVRLKMVKLLETSAGNNEVQGALIHALETDKNPGVRMKVIRLLKTLPINENIKKILMASFFRDPNSGVRREAVDALNHLDDPAIRPILEKNATEDEYTHALTLKNQGTDPSLSNAEI
jgi:hypothetical protein